MADQVIKRLRDFPSVEQLLEIDALQDRINAVPRPVATEIVRRVIAEAKRRVQQGAVGYTRRILLDEIRAELIVCKRREVTRVINATGILVHTNLGRAPIPEKVFDAVRPVVTGYGSIEYDLSRGVRGGRGEACERYLAMLAGAEAATVVNNCAAALFLILNTLANRKQVVISRGELVQIGGGFRIPDILRKAGAKLTEVGTTNITTLSDYEQAINDRTGLILKVHKSNFIQAGFAEAVTLTDLVALGTDRSVPVVNDLGSGAFAPTRELIGYDEPTVQQSVRQGATLTCFSGDKMLGGVQAGLVLGEGDLINKLKRNPLYRALRVDKYTFAMLERLLAAYLDGTCGDIIKLWRLLSVPESELYRRGKNLLDKLGNPAALSVEATRAYMGGGALPESHIPSVGIVFTGDLKAGALARRFRELDPPVIGRIEDDRFILDMRALSESELSELEAAIMQVLRELGA